MHRLYATVTFVLLLGFSAGASAQLSDQKLAEINRVAMEAYNNLDIETSKKALEDAIRGAERGNTHGLGLARTYSNLGVVVVGGLGDSSAGIDAFMRALKEDPKVEPDPIVSTPEVMTAFNTAKRKVASGAAPRPAAAPAPVESGPVEGNLSHTPAEEQLSQTAVPVFVSKGSVEAAKVKIFYRSLGMSKPKSAEMQQTDEGWIYLVPCTDVFEPTVEYFIIAEDEDGDQVGNAGTPEHPVTVPVVSTRTREAPSLPGHEPPVQCNASTECPPGMPGCSGGGGGSGQMGDTCRSSGDCSSGLSCVDEFCSLGSGDEEEDDDKDSGDAPKWHLDVGFGAGAVYVGEGKTADHSPSTAQVSEAQRRQLMGTVADADAYLVNSGWDCDLSPTPPLVASNCKVAIKKKGFVPTLILNFALGRYISPKLALALTGRIELERGQGTLAGLVLGGRGEYLVTTPAADGFHLGLTAGLGIGTIQARPPTDSKQEGPFATSAAQGGVGVVLGLGLRAGYRFTRNFGFQVSPGLSMGLPRILMAIDLQGGLELAF